MTETPITVKKFSSDILRMIAPVMSAVIATLLPIPESVRFIVSNMISSLFSYFADTIPLIFSKKICNQIYIPALLQNSMDINTNYYYIVKFLEKHNVVREWKKYSTSISCIETHIIVESEKYIFEYMKHKICIYVCCAKGDSTSEKGLSKLENITAVIESDGMEFDDIMQYIHNEVGLISQREMQQRNGVIIPSTYIGNYGMEKNNLFINVLTYISKFCKQDVKTYIATSYYSDIHIVPQTNKKTEFHIPTEKFGNISIYIINDHTEEEEQQTQQLFPTETYSVVKKEKLLVQSDKGIQNAIRFIRYIIKSKNDNFDDDNNNKISIYQLDRNDDKLVWVQSYMCSSRTLKNSIFTQNVQEEVINDIDGLLNIQKRLQEKDMCIPFRRGYFMYGPPGTGKSTIPMIVAQWLKCPLVLLNTSIIKNTNEFVHIMQLLKTQIHNDSLHIVSMDDIDKSSFFEKDNDISSFLNWVDGANASSQRLLFASVNDVKSINKLNSETSGALLRSGRFDKRVYVGPCDKHQFLSLYRILFDETIPTLSNRMENILDTDGDHESNITVADIQKHVISSRLQKDVFMNICEICERKVCV